MLGSIRDYRALPDVRRRMSDGAPIETFTCIRRSEGPTIDDAAKTVAEHEGFVVKNRDKRGLVIAVDRADVGELQKILPAWAIRPAKMPKRTGLVFTRS